MLASTLCRPQRASRAQQQLRDTRVGPGGEGGGCGGGVGRWTGHDTGAASLLELAGHRTRRSLLPRPPRSGRSHALALPRRLVGRTEVAPPRPCPNLPLAFRGPCCPAQSVPCGSASKNHPFVPFPSLPGLPVQRRNAAAGLLGQAGDSCPPTGMAAAGEAHRAPRPPSCVCAPSAISPTNLRDSALLSGRR